MRDILWHCTMRLCLGSATLLDYRLNARAALHFAPCWLANSHRIA
jgi:hypothetical protein